LLAGYQAIRNSFTAFKGGDALRILERSGAIAQTALTKIYGQQIPGLREAIKDLSKSRAGDGFARLTSKSQ
jgi:hypothetical protein